LIFAVRLIAQRLARPRVDGGGIARVDAVEAGVVVDIFARTVEIRARIARVEPPDGKAAVAQQLLVEAAGGDAEVRALQEFL
jgi:hypothetical protein